MKKDVKNLIINFNFPKKKCSLGALLILKQEIDFLIKVKKIKNINIFCQNELFNSHENVFNQIFPKFIEYNNSEMTKEDIIFWPIKQLEYQNEDSYQSFERILYLNKRFNKKPILNWDKNLINQAEDFLSKLCGKKYAVHLKNIYPYKTEESNANLSQWFTFFKKYALKGKRNFILIGKDQVSNDILKIPGMILADKENISLFTQLAMISLSDGFLGMASGLCQAAILSNTPFVIFKHPKHHPEITKKELDSKIGFSFCNLNQQIWIKEDKFNNIEKAFRLIE